MIRHYVYRWTGINCKEAELLGTVDTDKAIKDIWDLIAQVFCEGERGFFTRTRRIYD